MSPRDSLFFAGLGDVHGEIAEALSLLRKAEAAAGVAIQFVLQVGDFEAHRCPEDLCSMHAPHREKRLGDFQHYQSSDRTLPWPLYFIGGNHESYGVLAPKPDGVTLASRCHYLGRAGRRLLNGLDVAYLSGVYDAAYFAHDRRGESQKPASDTDFPTQRALACYRACEVDSIAEFKPPWSGGIRLSPQILVVHEWPWGIVRHEDHESAGPKPHRLFRFGETGEPVVRRLIDRLQPDLVICGHMHRPYRAMIAHDSGRQTRVDCLGSVRMGDGACVLYSLINGQVRAIGEQ